MGINVREGNFLSLNVLAKEMVFNIDVFDAVVE